MPDDRDLESHLDLLIDRALTSYSDIDPDPSLRARIVTRASKEQPRSLRLWSFAALACAAIFCLSLIYLVPEHPSLDTAQRRVTRRNEVRVGVFAPAVNPHAPARTATAPSQVPHPGEVRVGMSAPPIEPPRHARLSDASRLRVPHPNEVRVGVLRSRSMRLSEDTAQLTAEERALLQFVAERPEEAQRLLAVRAEDRDPLPSKPLSFAPIEIADLPAPEPLHAD